MAKGALRVTVSSTMQAKVWVCPDHKSKLSFCVYFFSPDILDNSKIISNDCKGKVGI